MLSVNVNINDFIPSVFQLTETVRQVVWTIVEQIALEESQKENVKMAQDEINRKQALKEEMKALNVELGELPVSFGKRKKQKISKDVKNKPSDLSDVRSELHIGVKLSCRTATFRSIFLLTENGQDYPAECRGLGKKKISFCYEISSIWRKLRNRSRKNEKASLQYVSFVS